MLDLFSKFPQRFSEPYNVFRGVCVDVYDGDTYTIVVDLGFHTYTRVRVRLRNVDTPEIKSKNLVEKENALKARDRVRELILQKPCVIHTDKDTTSFDRWIADVYWFDQHNALRNLAQTLLTENLAVPFTK